MWTVAFVLSLEEMQGQSIKVKTPIAQIIATEALCSLQPHA
jgi:hypothetical protein